MLKVQDIRSMTIDEIDAKIEALKKDAFSLRVQAKTGKLEKQHRVRVTRRDIARLLTVRNELAATQRTNSKKKS